MSIFDQTITGRNLPTFNIGELLNSDMQILIFLRHLGCNLSRQLIQDINRYEKTFDVKFPITYVSQGSRNYCEHFWSRNYPQAQVVYDPNLYLAKSFGLIEGTLIQVINPQSVFCSLKAMARGIFPKGIQGNVFMMPGVFVYLDGKSVFNHVSKNAGDLPEFENLVKLFLKKSFADHEQAS